MIEFQPSDFAPLSEFELCWRWTDPGYHPLPPEVLADIQPLSAAAAERVAPRATVLCTERRVSDRQLTIAAEWDSPDPVRARLAELLVAPSARVLVSWSASAAVVTSWRTFRLHWEAFCFPSSDDVTVWPLETEERTARGPTWVLCYRHFQVIEFGAPAPGAA